MKSSKGKIWQKTDFQKIKLLAKKKNMKPRMIASELGRSLNATRRKAQELGIKFSSLTIKSANSRKKRR